MRYYEITESELKMVVESTVKLSDLYDEDELADTSEELHRYVDPEDLTRDFVVHDMSPAQAMKYQSPRGDDTVFAEFKNSATKAQKQIVKTKAAKFDRSRIIVTINNTVLDGNHHLIAGIISKNSIKYIDLAEYI